MLASILPVESSLIGLLASPAPALVWMRSVSMTAPAESTALVVTVASLPAGPCAPCAPTWPCAPVGPAGPVTTVVSPSVVVVVLVTEVAPLASNVISPVKDLAAKRPSDCATRI